MTELERITKENLHEYKKFETSYEEHLKEYMSRLHPNHHENFEVLTNADLLRWYYIVFDKKRVGSIWLEKKQAEDSSAVLGLFIDNENIRGNGLGECVIDEIIEQNAEELQLTEVILRVRVTNPRAIKCYEKCGFQEVARGVGSTGVVGLEMVRVL